VRELTARSAFSGHLHPTGDGAMPGVIVHEVSGLGLASVFSRNGAFGERARAGFSIEPQRNAYVARGPIAFVGTGPGKWLALSRTGASGWANTLRQGFGETASVVDQSDGLGVLRVGGANVRQAFEKGFPIDFHPLAFPPGSAAVTLVAHIGVTVWQLNDAPTYEIAVFRSLAGSFMHWLSRSSAEFGLAIEPPPMPRD